jgi:hypothetical protein
MGVPDNLIWRGNKADSFPVEGVMFEQEIEMEKHQSTVVPLLLITVLIVAVVAIAGYYVVENHKTLSNQEATNLAVEILKSQAPPAVSFHTGLVKETAEESGRDARYRLLEKAGILKLGKAKGTSIPVALTPKGEDLIKQISGVQKSADKNDTQVYVVPLAERKLVAVSAITKTGTGRAFMEFSWQWQPNALGEVFDASGAALQAFNGWDRATLIQKHGANFYHQAPAKVVIAAVRGDKGWQPASE